MSVPSSAVLPTYGSKGLTEPQIHKSAQIHDASQVVGDVRISAEVVIEPGVSVSADAGSPFHIGEACRLQPGVVVYGLEQGRVLGDDGQSYSVWISSHTAVTHKGLIHGPAYIGEGCFIGFRSTIFNARLGQGCLVMMHALVQDVEIPPGKFVPSGTTVTTQAQADALPDVMPEDLTFAQEILGQPNRLRPSAVHSSNSDNPADWVSPVTGLTPSPSRPSNERNGKNKMQSQRLTPEVIQQVRQLLGQGYRIGTEHADSRRYRSGVWQTCTPVQSTRESEVFAALETCIAEHANDYVRMFGIDPKVKQRVATTTIQRGDGKPVAIAPTRVAAAGLSSTGQNGAKTQAAPVGTLSGAVVQQIRQLLNQGYRIGTEHADSRRYRSGVWQTCAPIQSTHEGSVLAAMQDCLQEHSGEYVRMFGIDPKVKQRVATTTIQRGDGKPVELAATGAGVAAAGNGHNGHQVGGNGQIKGDLVQHVRYFLGQGYRIGVEHADIRRYRSGVWQSCPTIEASHESGVMAALQNYLSQYADEYVRIFGIDSRAKRRVKAVTVQRPGQGTAPPSSGVASPPAYTAATEQYGSKSAAYQNGKGHSLSADVVQQVNQLINQGYRISTEFADVRRYRSGAWQTGSPIQARRPADVVARLEALLSEHTGEYVRLVGVDPQAKRRVLETTIQRP